MEILLGKHLIHLNGHKFYLHFRLRREIQEFSPVLTDVRGTTVHQKAMEKGPQAD